MDGPMDGPMDGRTDMASVESFVRDWKRKEGRSLYVVLYLILNWSMGLLAYWACLDANDETSWIVSANIRQLQGKYLISFFF